MKLIDPNYTENPILKRLMALPKGLTGRCILPYIYLRTPMDGHPGKSILESVMLQYDDSTTAGRHKKVFPENYSSAPSVEVDLGGVRELIYLAEAVQNSPDDVRVECKFANGNLWGWFPKHMVE